MPVTIIGEKLARVGLTFTYEGVQPECEPCKLRKVCHQGLDAHQPYVITDVKPVQHDVCTLFEGKVNVAACEPAPLRVAMPSAAVKGTGYSKRWEECGAACLFKRYCNPTAVPEGKSLLIEKVEADVPCLVGRKLKFAIVRPAVLKKG